MKGIDIEAMSCRTQDIEVGDLIANLGVVTGWTDVGVFRIFSLRGEVHDTTTGRIDIVTKELARHIAANNIIVNRPYSDFPRETHR